MTTLWFDIIPLWAVFLGTVAVVLLSISAGFGVGLWRRKTAEALAGPVGSVVGAMLGLLAFILAFTFGMAASRFDARKQLLLDEVNAIETTFLRADMIAEPHRSESRELLKKYADNRVYVGSKKQTVQDVHGLLAGSEDLQGKLWRSATVLAKSASNPEIDALFIASLNDLINVHALRVTTGLQYRIPDGVWGTLGFLTLVTMAAVGYQFGISGKNSYIVYCFLAVGFSLIITIIVALDNPARGALAVNQRPMIELQKRLSVTADEVQT